MSKLASIRIPPNPGGTLLAEHVVGRDPLVSDLWQRLDHQSIALMSPRRVGKTSVLERMKCATPDGWIVRARDLEGLQTGADFARYLYDDAGGVVSGAKGVLTRANELLQRLTGSIEIKNLKVNLQRNDWPRLIERLFEDLQAHLEGVDRRIVFFWDEFTLFVGDMVSRGRAEEAMVLLDTLRAARHANPRLRMVLTGSIGFHLVLRELDAAGYRNRPLNDVRSERVPMLAWPARTQLAHALVLGIDREPTDDVVDALARYSEGHPYVMQHLVDHLRARAAIAAADVAAALDELLTPPSVLDLAHYEGRLDKYYGELAGSAKLMLDALARNPDPLTPDEVAAETGLERTDVVELLRQLRDDDYLDVGAEGARFALELVRRYWARDRLVQ